MIAHNAWAMLHEKKKNELAFKWASDIFVEYVTS